MCGPQYTRVYHPQAFVCSIQKGCSSCDMHIAYLWQIMCILAFELHTGIEDLQLVPIGKIPRDTDPISTLHCKARWGSSNTAWLSALIIPLNNVQQSKSTKVLTLNYFWQLFSQSGTHESRAQRLWIPRSPTLILIAETNGWIISTVCIISQILQFLDECRDHLHAFFPSSLLLALHTSIGPACVEYA